MGMPKARGLAMLQCLRSSFNRRSMEGAALPTDDSERVTAEDMLCVDLGDGVLRMHAVATRREEPGGAYLEWIDVWIKLTVRGIQAEGAWSVMPDELRGFVQQIRTMHEQLRPGLRAELSGVEPGFDLRLEALERGAIVGDWRFQPLPPDGAWVAGHCGLDQSYLPEWIRGIESFLASSASNRSP